MIRERMRRDLHIQMARCHRAICTRVMTGRFNPTDHQNFLISMLCLRSA